MSRIVQFCIDVSFTTAKPVQSRSFCDSRLAKMKGLFGPPRPRLKTEPEQIFTLEMLREFDGGTDEYGNMRNIYTAILGVYTKTI